MKQIMLLSLVFILDACGNSETTATTPASGATETVESLAANPDRLKELREQCKTDRATLGDELCNRVAEATNQRFLGNGKTPYNPPNDAPKF